MNERQATMGIDKRIVMTVSGRFVSITNPQPGDILIEDIAHALAHQCRFGGHSRFFYSVAQHSVLVSHEAPPALAGAGLLHDAQEAYLVDLPRPLKLELPGYAAIEERFRLAICERFGLDPELSQIIKDLDTRALVTEGRDLGPENWEIMLDFGLEPLPVRIYPLLPAEAKTQFLRRFDVLFPEYA